VPTDVPTAKNNIYIHIYNWSDCIFKDALAARVSDVFLNIAPRSKSMSPSWGASDRSLRARSPDFYTTREGSSGCIEVYASCVKAAFSLLTTSSSGYIEVYIVTLFLLMYSLSKYCKHEFMSQPLVSRLLLYSMMSLFMLHGHLESQDASQRLRLLHQLHFNLIKSCFCQFDVSEWKLSPTHFNPRKSINVPNDEFTSINSL